MYSYKIEEMFCKVLQIFPHVSLHVHVHPSVSVPQPAFFLRICWTLRLCDVLANDLLGCPAPHPAVESKHHHFRWDMRRTKHHAGFCRALFFKHNPREAVIVHAEKKQEATTYSIDGSMGLWGAHEGFSLLMVGTWPNPNQKNVSSSAKKLLCLLFCNQYTSPN